MGPFLSSICDLIVIAVAGVVRLGTMSALFPYCLYCVVVIRPLGYCHITRSLTSHSIHLSCKTTLE